MKLIYIAGPYRASSIRGVQQNIERASDVAFKYWHKGFAVLCPHKNTALFDGEDNSDIWLNGDLEMLKRCDAIVMMNGWEKSKGATAEKEFAEEMNIPVYYEGDDIL